MTNYTSKKVKSSEQAISEFTDKRIPNLEQIKATTHFLNQFDKEKGWPPIVYSKSSKLFIPQDSGFNTPDIKLFKEATASALSNKKIVKILGSHWIHVVTQHISQMHYKYKGATKQVKPFEFRVIFYSYSLKQAVEVFIDQKKKLTINANLEIYITATYEEVQLAIKLAKSDKRISGYVSKLEAGAILESLTDKKHPSFGHRVIRIMFTKTYDKFKELPPLFYAKVDMNEEKVLIAGEAPCIQKSILKK